MKEKKLLLPLLTTLIIATLFLIGFTYAYYRTRIIGNQSKNPTISVTSKNLEIKFKDGNSTINMNGLIEPGFEYTKTFNIENTGDSETSYALYLENVINSYSKINDWEMEITCSPDCNGTNGVIKYPNLGEMITENKIPAGITQTYNVKINYINKNEDQSIDMGKKLSGKFQIYSTENIVDIEGTITNAEDGDYIQINSNPKKSQIIDGKYRLPAVEVGTHTLRVLKQDGTEKGSSVLNIETGNKNIEKNTVTIDRKSSTVILNIDKISKTLQISIENIKENGKGWDNATENTLLYALKTNQPKGTIETIPGQEISNENEARVVKTTDNYGVSYVYRGNVKNNYVNYSGMCWRVLRVQGDGTIKLVLADEHGECDDETYTTDIFINPDQLNNTALMNNGEEYSFSSSLRYKASNIPNALNNWMNKTITNTKGIIIREKNLDISKLTNTSFCNDLRIARTTNNSFGCYSDEMHTYCSGRRFYIYKGIERLENASPSLECNLNQQTENIIGILTADEAVFAGGMFKKENTKYYLSDNAASTYLTMTPNFSAIDYTTNPGGADYEQEWEQGMISISYGGEIVESFIGGAIRPIITLKNNVLATFNKNSEYEIGTHQNPYIVN